MAIESSNFFKVNSISPRSIAERVDFEQKQLCNESIFPSNFLGKNILSETNPQVEFLA